MADVKESALTTKSPVVAGDKLRGIGVSDSASYNMLVQDVAKYIIENYAGSSVAGSAQSVKSALDTLNSKIAVSTHISVTVSDGFCRIPYPDGFDRNASIFIQPLYVSGGVIGWESTLQLTLTDVIVYIRQNGSSPASGAIVSFKALFVKP